MSIRNIERLTESAVMSEILLQLSQAPQTWWGGIVLPIDSVSPAGENIGFLGGHPQMTEQTGSPKVSDFKAFEFYLKNIPWQVAVTIDQYVWRSKANAQIQARINQGVNVVLSHPGVLLQELIALGTTRACMDGQFYFDTDHPYGGASDTQSNLLSLTTLAPTTPTASEFVKAVVQAIGAITAARDDQGNEVNMDAKDFLIAYPTHYTEAALTALNAQLVGGGNTNILNGARDGLTFTGQHLPRWSGNNIAVFRKRAVGQGTAFVRQVFAEVEPEILGYDSEYRKEHGKLLFKHSGLYNMGFGNYQDACLVNFV